MRNKIFYIAIIIILTFALFVLFRPIQCSNPGATSKTDTAYSIGKAQSLYLKGKDSISLKTNSFHGKKFLNPSAIDNSYHFTSADSSHKLEIILTPAADSNLSMDYSLDIFSKNLVRIDTIFQSRIDTLKITERILENLDPPFYNTFLFGAIITSTIILLLISLIK